MSELLLPAISLGSLRVEWPVFLAPMAGYTDGAFRSLCLELGAGAVVTEMVSAYGLMIGHKRTEHYLDTWGEEHPLGAQIYGSDPAVMAAAAALIAERKTFDFLDINAGCPVPKIRNRGDGAGLMRDPGRLAEIVRQVRAAVAGALPVTVKTRIGWDSDRINALETTAAAEEAGADAIFLHARAAAARHSGPADWERIGEVKRVRRIPIIGNGGIRTAAEVFARIRETGVDGVMIGQAALGNPWIFREIRDLAAGREPLRPTTAEVRSIIHEHLRREMDLLSRRGPRELKRGVELTACLVLRAHLVRYLRGYRGLRLLTAHLTERQDRATLLRRVEEVLASGRRAAPRDDS